VGRAPKSLIEKARRRPEANGIASAYARFNDDAFARVCKSAAEAATLAVNLTLRRDASNFPTIVRVSRISAEGFVNET